MFHSARIARAGAQGWQESKQSIGLWTEQEDRPDEDLRLGDLLAILRRNLPSIAACTALGLGLGLAYIALVRPVYSSLTQILVDSRSRTAVDTAGGTVSGQIIPDPGLMESQEKILRSYAVLNRVVTGENLGEDAEFTRSPFDTVLEVIKVGPFRDKNVRPDSPELRQQTAIQTLAMKTFIKRAPSSYVLDVEVHAKDPVKAARLARALAEAYLGDQAGAKAGEAKQANTMLDSRLTELREAVRVADTQVEDFRFKNGLLLATGSLVNEQQLTQIATGLVQAQAATAEARARTERMQRLVQGGGVADTVTESLGSAVVQRLREQLAAAAQREAALASRLQPGHPDMIDISSRLTSLRGQLNAEFRRILEASRSELEIARSREAQFVERSDAIKKETNEKNQTRVQLAALERDAAAVRKQLETFMGRERDTREQQQLFTPDARIITPAQVPRRAVAPNKIMVLALSLLGGLGAGLAQALMRAQLDGTVRSGEQVTQGVGLRFLTAMPVIARSRLRSVLNLGSKYSRIELASDAFLEVLEAMSPQAPATAKTYRSAVLRLAANLRGNRLDPPAKCLLIVSASSGEGKSCLALSLAQAEAQAGNRTLLIDADFRNADLSSVFAPKAAGQASKSDLEQAVYTSMVCAFNDGDCDLLPLSAIMMSVGRQMRLNQMVEGLSRVAEPYDRVVIDGGSLLDDGIAATLMGVADQVVLIARSGKTQSADLQDAAGAIDIPLDRRSGVVVTMSPDAARQRLRTNPQV